MDRKYEIYIYVFKDINFYLKSKYKPCVLDLKLKTLKKHKTLQLPHKLSDIGPTHICSDKQHPMIFYKEKIAK